MKQKKKPRRKDNKLTFDLVVRDGNTPIIEVREEKFSALADVLETMRRKL